MCVSLSEITIYVWNYLDFAKQHKEITLILKGHVCKVIKGKHMSRN